MHAINQMTCSKCDSRTKDARKKYDKTHKMRSKPTWEVSLILKHYEWSQTHFYDPLHC